MKNNGRKINLINSNIQQIKVNIKQKNNNISLKKYPIYPDTIPYEDNNHNNLILEDMKDVKNEKYIGPNSYSNRSVFTEYNTNQKYSYNPSSIYKFANLPSKYLKHIYNNSNNNIDKETNLEQNKNKYKNNSNEEYINKSFGKKRKEDINNKENIDSIPLSIAINNNLKNNSKENKKAKFKKGLNLNKNKNEIKYILNFFKNIPINNSKYKTYNNNSKSKDKINDEKLNSEISNKDEVDKNIINGKKRSFILSPDALHLNSNKNSLKQNNSSFGLIKTKKNNVIKPDNLHLSNIKTPNYNTYSSNENDMINLINYNNSCYNFYNKKTGSSNSNSQRKDINNLNMFNTTNNNEYYNYNYIINSPIENKRRKSIYDNNNKDNYEIENGCDFVDFIEPTENSKKKTRNSKNKMFFNENNYSNNINNMNFNSRKHKKVKSSFEICDNLFSLNNNEMKFNNILDINKYIQYKKKILDEFCNYLEEYIFITIKNNFDIFIYKLKEFCKQKNFHSLLLRRLQNKNSKKIFYKDNSSLSNRYIRNNSENRLYSSLIMNKNNSNIIKNTIKYNIPIETAGRKTINDDYNTYRNAYIIEESHIGDSKYRLGKSHDKYKVNNIDNYNVYNTNDSYNIEEFNDKRKNINKRINNIESYNNKINKLNDNNLYIRKKFKYMNNLQLSDKKNPNQKLIINNYNHLNITENNHKILNSEINDFNKNNNIENDILKAKVVKIYIKNNNINYQGISYDNNYIRNKAISKDLSNQNNDIYKNNNNTLLIENKNDFNMKPIKPIYKKKIKINRANSKIFKSKQIPNHNKKSEIIEGKNNEKKLNSYFEKKQNINLKEKDLDISSEKSYKEIKSNNIKDNILEISTDKRINNDYSRDENNQISQIEDINYENTQNNQNIEKKIDNNQKNVNIPKNINEYNILSNGDILINDDLILNNDNIIREIIVKDVCTSDKRLNVFIKYIDNYKKIKSSNNFSHLLNIFQTDSFFLPSSISKKKNKNKNKILLHNILSSIIEEEEKSKICGSVNNSDISEEDNYNGNYNNIYIQSIKYITNLLQSIFNEKERDIVFKAFKILKRIKNDAFLKGLINQKKLKKLKDENNTSTSKDIKFFSPTNNLYANNNYCFSSKSNDRKDIRNKYKKNKINEHKNSNKKKINKKTIQKIKEEMKLINKKIIIDKKYVSAKSVKNIYSKNLSINFDKNKENIKFRNNSCDNIPNKIINCENKGENISIVK